jgi:hypothetical protein
MTKSKDDRWWLQGLGLAAGAVWAGARALSRVEGFVYSKITR